MLKKSLFVFLLFNIFLEARTQQGLSTFEWMVTTFEQNDAGFKDIVEKNGRDQYNQHTSRFREKVASATSEEEGLTYMNDWLQWFRPDHIGIIKNVAKAQGRKLTNDEIRALYKNTPTIDLTERALVKQLEGRKNSLPIEGVWSNGRYTIGIVKDTKAEGKLSAFIIKADNLYWMPGQIKANLKLNSDGNTYDVEFFLRDHSAQNVTAKLVGSSGALLEMSGLWNRVYPKVEMNIDEQLAVKALTSKKPFVQKIDLQTVYLRIPSFSIENKPFIDSVLIGNDSLLASTCNLIIDIRNGTGGSDFSFKKLMPYLYTQPFRSSGMEYYATELNAHAYELYADEVKEDSVTYNYCINTAKLLRANLGKFVTLSDGKRVYVDTLDRVMPNPQRVGIICNKNNGSTDEAFLLLAKQSRKVKVFGHPTGGMLDYSNLNQIASPNGQYTLFTCVTRSFRIPHYCIDGVGIQPDYFIDDTIDEMDWIDFTRRTLQE
ncbi:MAG: S41 family peptidase [Breznakibacter sp.]